MVSIAFLIGSFSNIVYVRKVLIHNYRLKTAISFISQRKELQTLPAVGYLQKQQTIRKQPFQFD